MIPTIEATIPMTPPTASRSAPLGLESIVAESDGLEVLIVGVVRRGVVVVRGVEMKKGVVVVVAGTKTGVLVVEVVVKPVSPFPFPSPLLPRGTPPHWAFPFPSSEHASPGGQQKS